MKAHKPHAQLNGNDKRTRDKHQKSVAHGPGTKPKTSPGFVPSSTSGRQSQKSSGGKAICYRPPTSSK